MSKRGEAKRTCPRAALLCLTALFAAALPAPRWGFAEDGTDIERAVVRIVNFSQRADWFSPWDRSPVREESGSGFVVAGGRVMTNAHVVSDSRMSLLYLHGDPTPHQARVAVVGHDCDLALLEPLEKGLLDGIKPLEFGGLPKIRDTVETYGYPAGGQRLSLTRGVVSRIELQAYVHTGLDGHLTVQTDAAINPGNSGGPVIENGLVVGVAFQVNPGLSNVGYFIPTEVIQHFLRDAADGSYQGYPELGVMTTANMENPAARRKAGMGQGETGVRVVFVLPRSNADGVVKPGDVLLAVDGVPVANDGSVDVEGMRLPFGVLADRRQTGETMALRLLRDRERIEASLRLDVYPPQQRYANTYDRPPRYFVYGGLVFAPLSRDLLETFGNRWMTDADRQLLFEFFLRIREEPDRMAQEPVVLLRRLDHPVNARITPFKNQVVERVNGRTVERLEDVIEAIETEHGGHHVIEFGKGGALAVLDRAEAEAANRTILERYGVHKDRNL